MIALALAFSHPEAVAAAFFLVLAWMQALKRSSSRRYSCRCNRRQPDLLCPHRSWHKTTQQKQCLISDGPLRAKTARSNPKWCDLLHSNESTPSRY